MPHLRLLLIMALALGPAAAKAQSTAERAYVRAGAGSAQWRTDCEGTTSCDHRNMAVQIGAGFRLTDHIAAEAGLADFRKLQFANEVLDVAVRTHGLLLGAAWLFDVTPSVTASLRGGVALLDVTQRVTSASGVARGSSSHTTPYVGVSTALRLSPQLALELNAQFTRLEQNEQGLNLDRGRVGMLTFGIRTSF